MTSLEGKFEALLPKIAKLDLEVMENDKHIGNLEDTSQEMKTSQSAAHRGALMKLNIVKKKMGSAICKSNAVDWLEFVETQLNGILAIPMEELITVECHMELNF